MVKKTFDDSVTVDDQCDVQCENVDVGELSMDLVSVNGSFEKSVTSLSLAKFPDNLLVSIPNLKFDYITREEYIQLLQSDESQEHVWDWAKSIVCKCIIVNGVLMCLRSTNGSVSLAVFIPMCFQLQTL